MKVTVTNRKNLVGYVADIFDDFSPYIGAGLQELKSLAVKEDGELVILFYNEHDNGTRTWHESIYNDMNFN